MARVILRFQERVSSVEPDPLLILQLRVISFVPELVQMPDVAEPPVAVECIRVVRVAWSFSGSLRRPVELGFVFLKGFHKRVERIGEFRKIIAFSKFDSLEFRWALIGHGGEVRLHAIEWTCNFVRDDQSAHDENHGND